MIGRMIEKYTASSNIFSLVSAPSTCIGVYSVSVEAHSSPPKKRKGTTEPRAPADAAHPSVENE
jgi:hypothetical protein